MLPQSTIVHFVRLRQFTVPVQALELCVQPIDFARRQVKALVSDSLKLRWTQGIHALDSRPWSAARKANWSWSSLLLLILLWSPLAICTVEAGQCKQEEEEDCNQSRMILIMVCGWEEQEENN